MYERTLGLIRKTFLSVILLGLVGLGIYSLVHNKPILENLKDTIYENIQESTQFKINWEKATIFPLNRLIFTDVSIADLDGEEAFFLAKRLVIRYRFWDLLVRQVGLVNSIEEIVVDNFILEGDRALGLANQPLASEGDNPFRARILLKNGQASLSLAEASQEKLENISGYLDFKNVCQIDVSLQGDLNSLDKTRIDVQGVIDNYKMTFVANLAKTKAQYLLPFLSRNVPSFDLNHENMPSAVDGLISGQLTASGRNFKELKFQGRLKIEKGSFLLPYLDERVTNLNTSISISPQNISLDEFTCNLFGAFIAAEGFVDPEDLDGNVEATISKVSLKELLASLNRLAPNYFDLINDFGLLMDGVGDISLKVVGNWQEPFIDCLARFPKGTLDKNDFKDLCLDLRYQKNLLAVKDVSIDIEGGVLGAKGSIRWFEGKPYFSFTANAADFSASILTGKIFPKEFLLDGNIHSTLFLAGYSFNWSEMTAIGNLSILDGHLFSYPFTEAEASFWMTKGELLLSPFLAQDGKGGILKAQGAIDGHGAIDFLVDALNVNLGEYQKDLTGCGEFRGNVSGTLDEPVLSGMLTGKNVFLFDKELGEVKGNAVFDLVEKHLCFSDFRLRHSQGTVSLGGDLNWIDGEPQFSIVADFKGPSLDNLLSFFALDLPLQLDGSIEGDVSIYGAFPSLRVKGELTVQDGLIDEQEIDFFTACFDWQEGEITLETFGMALQEGKVIGKGKISEKGQLDIVGIVADLALADLVYVKEYAESLEGKFDFNGKITGSISEPEISGEVFVYDLAWEDSPLGNLKGELFLDQKEVNLLDWEYRTQAGIYCLTGKADLFAEGLLDISFSVLNGSLLDISPFSGMLKDWFAPLPFIVDGEAKIFGKINNPYIIFSSLFRWNEGEAGAKGEGYLKGPFDMNFEGQAIDLAIMNNFPGLPWPIEGKADVSLVGSYREVWNFSGKNSLYDLKFGGLFFKDISGDFQWEEGGIVRVDQVLKREKDQLIVKGSIPLIDSVMGLEVEILGQGVQLDFLPLFLDDMIYSQGLFDVSMTLVGSRLDPRLNGSIKVSGGAFNYIDVPGVFSGLEGTIRLAGNQIFFEKIKGYFNDTGRLDLDGYMLLNGWLFSYYDLNMKLKRIPLSHGAVNGFFDGELAVIGPLNTPRITGIVDIYNTTVKIPFIWPLDKMYDQASEAQPRLSIVLRPLGNVKAVSDNFEVLVQSGELQLDNTAGNFELVGELQSRQGKINYYSTNFRLVEGKAKFLRFSNSIPHLSLKAQSKIRDTTVYLSVDGPALDMAMNLSSVPIKDEQEIMSLLISRGGLGSFLEGDISGAIQGEFWRLMGETFHFSFLSQLEHSLEEVFQLDEFSITPFFYSGEQHVQLHLGKALTENLYLSYMQSFFGDRDEKQLGASLRLHKHVFLEGLYQGDNNFQIGIEFHFPFN